MLLAYADDQLRIEVSDDGVGATEVRPGHGLIGMRERTAAYGGRLETETRDGFTVRALLPTTMTPMTRVVVVDDQELVRAGFRLILERAGHGRRGRGR